MVAISLTAVLMVAIPAMRELGRAARSAEKLFDTLGRELPPTLEAIRLTGLEITELTDDMSEGVQNAGRIVKQVDQGVASARQQAKTLNTGRKSLFAGARAAWNSWTGSGRPASRQKALARSQPSIDDARVRPSSPQPPGHSLPNTAGQSHRDGSSAVGAPTDSDPQNQSQTEILRGNNQQEELSHSLPAMTPHAPRDNAASQATDLETQPDITKADT
jgi:hypothetical protein